MGSRAKTGQKVVSLLQHVKQHKQEPSSLLALKEARRKERMCRWVSKNCSKKKKTKTISPSAAIKIGKQQTEGCNGGLEHGAVPC